MPSSIISFAAVAIAIIPDEHCRSSDIAGTLSGSPARSALCRATLNPCAPCWIAAPRITSSISAGSMRARLTASAIACPARACGWVSLKAPRNALPIGVRAVETMTAWRMGQLLRSGGRFCSPALRSADHIRSSRSPSAKPQHHGCCLPASGPLSRLNPRPEPALIHCAPRRNRPDALDPVAANADIPVVKVDGRVAMTGHEAHLVAELQAVSRATDRQPAVLVGGALVGRGRLVPHGRRPGIERQGLQPGIDDRA